MPSAGRATTKPTRRPAAGVSPPSVPSSSSYAFTDRLARLRRAHSALGGRSRLLELVGSLYASHHPQDIGRVLVDCANRWIPMTCWSVIAYDLQGQPELLAESGLAPDLGTAVLEVARWVVQHDRRLASGNAAHAPSVSADAAVAVLAFPLRGRERIVGALVGVDRGVSAATPHLGARLARDVDVLLDAGAAALDTALLLRRTESLSVTDDITQLYNARYLNLVLRREIKLAARSGRPLSLLFIDLDGFKSINDNHGHLAGSRALLEAGTVIRASARETDIVARFGGDEFALVLPDTAPAGALAVAERVRDRLARHGFLAREGLDIHLTASVGVATLSDAAGTADDLVHAADAAMYQVKNRGKNGIQAAGPRR